MKKTLLNLLAIILAVSMVFTMAPLSMDHAYADDSITIEGVVYTPNEDGITATVSGYTYEPQGAVTIPASVQYNDKQYAVTSIGNYAFYCCNGLESITLSEGITSIGESAFQECPNLTTIKIPVSVTFIDIYAFNDTSLTTVYFDGTRSQWAKITGEGKPSDDIVHCVPTIFTIEGVEYTLNDDGTTVTVSGWDETIQSTVGIPQRVRYGDEGYTVTSVGDYAFNNCEGLRTITLPESLTSIGENAFEGCTNLTAITIPEKVTSIGEYAFRNCSNLTTITIPVSVTYIGEEAFKNDISLTTVNFGGTKAQWEAITGGGKPENATVNYTMMIDKVAYLQNNDDGTAVVTGWEETIESTVRIPQSVPYDNKNYTVIGIAQSAFKECNRIQSVILPNGVTSIGDSAFSTSKSLETITLPDSLKSIGLSAFYYCSALESITLPDSLESIGMGAFRYSGLKSITIPASVTSIGGSVFQGSTKLTSVEFAEGSKITTIPASFLNGCSGLKSFEIPASVTSIEGNAFNGCAGFTSITLPDKVTSIGEYAFRNCSNLTTITIPESVTYIGEGAFENDISLTTVNFGGSKSQWEAITGEGKPTGVTVNYAKDYPVFTTIYGVAYVLNEDRTATVTGYTADLPAEVIIPQSIKYENEDFSVKSIKDFAFMDCSSLKNITIPEGVTSIGNCAFWDSGLTSVTFAEGSQLTIIDEGAFAGCQSLGTITIPEGITSIEKNAFFGCAGLTTVNFLGSEYQWNAITGDGKPNIEGASDIIFKNEDGTELQFSRVKSGETPSYEGATPTKAADAQYTYKFKGWTPEITAVTGDATYTATYDKAKNLISIKDANVALSAATLTYNGAVQKPAVTAIGSWKMAEGTDYTAAWSNAASKDIGTYSVTVTGKGKYKDSAAASYQIVPKGTTLKKPKKAKKAVTVKWKKQKSKMPKARISGYRIQLATDSAFTMNVKTVNVKGYKKTSKKVKKLKGKTMYYVRVCTYMKSGGNTYYSPWSNFKTVKTK